MCFFLEPKGVSPNVTPPRKKGTITINHYDPISKALFPGVAWGGGLILDSESDVAAPFPALEKMNFLRGSF